MEDRCLPKQYSEKKRKKRRASFHLDTDWSVVMKCIFPYNKSLLTWCTNNSYFKILEPLKKRWKGVGKNPELILPGFGFYYFCLQNFPPKHQHGDMQKKLKQQKLKQLTYQAVCLRWVCNSMTQTSVSATNSWLKSRHILVPGDWLEACVEWIIEENQVDFL